MVLGLSAPREAYSPRALSLRSSRTGKSFNQFSKPLSAHGVPGSGMLVNKTRPGLSDLCGCHRPRSRGALGKGPQETAAGLTRSPEWVQNRIHPLLRPEPSGEACIWGEARVMGRGSKDTAPADLARPWGLDFP